MNNYIVLFREPDGRTIEHGAEEVARHRQNWKEWMAVWGAKGRLAGGSGLSLNGKVIRGPGQVNEGSHRVGKEIIGGFLLLKAESLEEAVGIAESCPIYEFR